MKFVYTDSCDLLSIGAKFKLIELNRSEDIFDMDLDMNVSYSGDNKKSALEVNQKHKSNKNESNQTAGHSGENPIKLLQDVARRWGIKGLAKRYHSFYLALML